MERARRRRLSPAVPRPPWTGQAPPPGGALAGHGRWWPGGGGQARRRQPGSGRGRGSLPGRAVPFGEFSRRVPYRRARPPSWTGIDGISGEAVPGRLAASGVAFGKLTRVPATTADRLHDLRSRPPLFHAIEQTGPLQLVMDSVGGNGASLLAQPGNGAGHRNRPEAVVLARFHRHVPALRHRLPSFAGRGSDGSELAHRNRFAIGAGLPEIVLQLLLQRKRCGVPT